MKSTNAVGTLIDGLMERQRGVLKLRPAFVCRYYKDGGRLAAPKNAALGRKLSCWAPERWIASTVSARNPDAVPGEGLSMLSIPGRNVSLKQALELRSEQILGPALTARYGPQFPVLSKVLDPCDPIMFHFHPRDEDVRGHPEHFAPHQGGKEEAYYFLPAPKGRVPYTHAGLYPDVTPEDLLRAIEKGSDAVLDLSPAFPQRFGQGFRVPAGVPHRPGTALTLEVQQPSDAFIHLEWFLDGRRLAPEQTHPGFASIEESLEFLDWEAARNPRLLVENRLVPESIAETRQRGGEEAWIFPPAANAKFSGKRVRVTGVFEMTDEPPYAFLIWSGQGELDGRPVTAGDEFFVAQSGANARHLLVSTGKDALEAFKFFPPVA